MRFFRTSRAASFRRRVAIAVMLLVATSLSVAAIGMWGVIRIHEDSTVALRGYRQLREVYEVGVRVAQARQALHDATPNVAAALGDADRARAQLELFTHEGWLEVSKSDETALRADLNEAVQELASRSTTDALDRALWRLANLAAQVRTTVEAHQSAAAAEKRVSLVLIGIFSGVFVLLSLLIGVLHYRSVVHPVDQLASAVRRFASGHLDDRVEPSGQREFAELARDLNHMADELQSLYRDLERKVAEKSRELVRSERLASVGYLAAGVAHEINNPLGIIAAYAERALQRIRRGTMDAQSTENILQAFQIICDEAFRCKEITDRLLTMARSSGEGRRAVSIAALAQEVVAMVAGLPQYRHAHLTLECGADHKNLMALVNDSEIKQVLLNLLVNAFEAIDGIDGQIKIIVKQSRDQLVELTVIDNGRGMEIETLNRIFEPFFSHKKGERHGTGLGLSICHAIAESHGGRLTAMSDGVGKGSRFVLSLPNAKEVHVG